MSTAPEPAHVVDPGTDRCSCGSDHDHGPTGNDVVHALGRGFAILSLLTPLLALVLFAACLVATPTSAGVLFLGIGLGLAHLALMLVAGAVGAKKGPAMTASPWFLVGRVAIEELLRLLVALIALVTLSWQWRGALGLWIGVGAMLVWAILATVQLATSRRRIARPSDWSKETVLSVLDGGISVRRAMTVRFVDIAGLFLFQLGACTLVTAAPIMTVATIVLSIASGLSTLIVQSLSPARRKNSPWVFAPCAIGVVTAALAVAFVLAPGVAALS
ncbi:hypothetical protein [Dermabacter sp. HSID17554]|uniref:hypothetical protein n=1 Tax=Dermabacter sp. HSID17554 TaxID=2419511 RepID=UPI000F869A24|nr:hypothetical protein [Dermabacter sp. HSID17554]RUP86022.1 hypothetical protein D8M36_06285 [Dermabacter sp. HSID17554]